MNEESFEVRWGLRREGWSKVAPIQLFCTHCQREIGTIQRHDWMKREHETGLFDRRLTTRGKIHDLLWEHLLDSTAVPECLVFHSKTEYYYQVCRNPNTPPDVLRWLATTDNHFLSNLLENPALPLLLVDDPAAHTDWIRTLYEKNRHHFDRAKFTVHFASAEGEAQ